MNNLRYHVPFSPQELHLEVCLSANQRNYLFTRRWVIIPRIKEQRQKPFSAKIDETFLKVHAKNLVKVTRTEEVMGRKRTPILRKFSLKFRH